MNLLMFALTPHIQFEIIIPFLLAIGNRIRGGWLGPEIGWGTQTARIMAWGIPCALSAFICGVPLWISLLFGIGMWVGSTLPIPFDMLNMYVSGKQLLLHVVLCSVRWLIEVMAGTVFLFLFYNSHIPELILLPIGGMMAGLCYFIGRFTPRQIVNGQSVSWAGEFGESSWGLIFGLSIVLAFIL